MPGAGLRALRAFLNPHNLVGKEVRPLPSQKPLSFILLMIWRVGN